MMFVKSLWRNKKYGYQKRRHHSAITKVLVRGVGFEPTKAFAIGASWAIGTDPPRHSVLPL